MLDGDRLLRGERSVGPALAECVTRSAASSG